MNREIAKLGIICLVALAVALLISGCRWAVGGEPTPTPSPAPTPSPTPVGAPPSKIWEKGSPPPAGIGGWQQPRPLTDAEKARVVEIAVNSPEASAWLKGRTDHRVAPVDWYAIIWRDGKVAAWYVSEYKVVSEGIPSSISPYAYWYPGVTIALGQGTIYQMQIAVDLDAGKTAMVDGPYPSLSSPDRFRNLTPPPISREQAVDTASKTLRPSIVSRAEIKAEIHGWYWEVIFDNLNAQADELMPFPLKGPPPPPPGQPTPEPYPGIWQSVVITIDAQTGRTSSAGARRAPRPGPYVSQAQAVGSAREFVLRVAEWSWTAKANVEAYLQGDIWTVLFWEEGQTENRIKASVDAVTGAATGARRG